MERAVDGDNVTLCEHLLEVLNTTAANLLLLLRAKRLVVEVEELLAVEGLQTAEDTLADTANGNGTDNLALEIELVLGGLGDVPVTTGDLLASGTEVADESEDGHDDVLGDGGDVGAGDFKDFKTLLDSSIEVDVVRADTGGDADFQVLSLERAPSDWRVAFRLSSTYRVEQFAREVARMEGSGDDDIGLICIAHEQSGTENR